LIGKLTPCQIRDFAVSSPNKGMQTLIKMNELLQGPRLFCKCCGEAEVNTPCAICLGLNSDLNADSEYFCRFCSVKLYYREKCNCLNKFMPKIIKDWVIYVRRRNCANSINAISKFCSFLDSNGLKAEVDEEKERLTILGLNICCSFHYIKTIFRPNGYFHSDNYE